MAVAVTGLLLASPIMAFTALAIKLESKGPVLYSQVRAGQFGKLFTILKFRSMRTDAEKHGAQFAKENDDRVTKIGKIIRKTRIDELPQLWNVLKGDMSLVGPRPLPMDEASGCQQWQRRRLDVTPGLTCIWQVKGRSRVTFSEWMRMDVEYIQRQTLWHDLKILTATVPAVLLRRGAR